MSELASFFEVVFGPNEPFRTVQATIRQWRNRGLAENASGGGRKAMGRRKVSTDDTEQAPTIDEAKLSVWSSLPCRFRIEKDRQADERIEPSLVVVNGDDWWHRDHQGHVETSEASSKQERRRPTPGLTDIQRHFDQASLREYFVGLSLQESGLVQTAGRHCVRVRAVPRPARRLWPHWLPYGADDYELHADPERGVLLYVAGRHSGEVFESSEVLQVGFDAPLDDGLFNYMPAVGEQVRPAEPIVERLTLQAAVARMPFTVLIPARAPDSEHGDFEVMYHPPRPRSTRAHLSVMYRGGLSFWINEADGPEPELAKFEWEQIHCGGRRMAISDPETDDGMRVVALEHLGTHVTIWSALDRKRLIDVAASLRAASEVLHRDS